MEASKAILGISPGTRSMGFAVVRRGELIEWRVKTFKGVWSKEKLAHLLLAIGRICDYFQITGIAIKKVDPLRSSKQLDILNECITALAKKKALAIATYSLPEIKEVCKKQQKNVPIAVAEYALELYPEIRKEYLKERNNKREYYSKMFEAILCAHMLHIASIAVQ